MNEQPIDDMDRETTLAITGELMEGVEWCVRNARRGERIFLLDLDRQAIVLEALSPSPELIFKMLFLKSVWATRSEVEAIAPEELIRWRRERGAEHFFLAHWLTADRDASGIDYETHNEAMASRIIDAEEGRGGVARSRRAMMTEAPDLAEALRRWETGDDSAMLAARGGELIGRAEEFSAWMRDRAPADMAGKIRPRAV